MAGACPALVPEDPIVRSLLGVVDCNVREIVHTGYSAIFQSGGPLAGLLTMLLTIYVALIGYQLMLGRTQLRVSGFALNAVKLGAVLALTTQWDTYQAVVYSVLFQGPQHLASSMLGVIQPDGSAFHGDVFDGLQAAFDDLSNFGAGFASRSPSTASPLIGGPGLGAMLMNVSASVLLLSTLGVLLAAKIVLGLLLAVGPLFIALLLFDSTRGIFEGWLRASLAFAFAPLASTLLLSVALTMMEPALLQMEAMQSQHVYVLAPAYSLLTLILVFSGVSMAALVAGGMVASGFRLPRIKGPATEAAAGATSPQTLIIQQTRAGRVAAAVVARDRRDTSSVLADSRSDDRRSAVTIQERAQSATAEPVRLGQTQRRSAAPKSIRPTAPRSGARSAR